MSRALIAALMIAACAGAARAQVAVCAPNPELDAKSYALWITDKINPDDVPCSAMLAQISCSASDAGEYRIFTSADRRYSVFLRIAPNGAVTISLRLDKAAGVVSGRALLATYPYHRAIYRGVGADGVQVFDEAEQTTKSIGNVMVIPAEALTENGKKMCPAR